MHVSVCWVFPHSLAVFVREASQIPLDDFIVEEAENCVSCPLVLQNDNAGKKRVVLKMQKDAKIVEIPAEM